MAEYKVKLPIFEGPLDLLLHLIRQNEMEISEISISNITSQYLEYLRLMEALDLDIAGDFLVMAASLLNIKLRSLLPASAEEEQAEQEEELDNFVSARQLMTKLIEYRKFKEAAYDLGNRAERQAQIFVRDVALPALAEAEKDDTIRGDLSALLQAFGRVLQFVERRPYHEVHTEEFTVEEKITDLRRRVLTEPRIALSEIFDQCRVKIEMIVTLIAVLELCRLKELRVRQNEHFGEVFVFRMDAAPQEEIETMGGTKKLTAAAALERIEAEIIASRTGIIDDGEPAPDTEHALLDMLYNETLDEALESADPAAAESIELAEPIGIDPELGDSDSVDPEIPEIASAADQLDDSASAEIVELHPEATPSDETDPDQPAQGPEPV